MSEWADNRRFIPVEENPAEPGKWRTSRAEYQRAMMDAVNEPGIYKVVYYTSSGVGKTSLLENVMGYFIDHDPCPILTVQPTEADAQEWSKDYLASFVRDTPCLAEKISDAKAKSGDNTILHKKFPGGYLKAVGANSPRGFRRTTVRLLLADEIDGYPPSAGPEGDPLGLAEKRARTWNRLIVLASTATVKGLSRIEREWELSDQRHCFIPCPHCGHFQVLNFGPKSQFAHLGKGFLRINKENPGASCYICEECQKEIYEADKFRMIAACRWEKTKPEVAGVAGFHLNALYSTFMSWGQIADEWLKTDEGRRVEQLRIFVNTTLGETFNEERSYTISEHDLEGRIEAYDEVPASALVLTGQADVQENRVECLVVAWGLGEESWLVDYAVIPGSPDHDETWKGVLAFFERPRKHASGIELTIPTKFVDSGSFTHRVYRFTRANAHKGYWAIKGHGGRQKEFLSRPRRVGREGALLVTIAVDEAKQTIYDRLQQELPGPGTMHFNRLADEEFFRQLTAEKRVIGWKQGHPTVQWQLKGRHQRNEILDLYVYGLAAVRFMRINWARLKVNMDARIASNAASPKAEVTEGKGVSEVTVSRKVRTRPISQRTWVNRWRY